MSTEWFYECLEHHPPLKSDSEFTQHTDDVYFEHAMLLASQRPVMYSEEERYNMGSAWSSEAYFDMNAREFLVNHPTCLLGIISEYGERRTMYRAEPPE